MKMKRDNLISLLTFSGFLSVILKCTSVSTKWQIQKQMINNRVTSSFYEYLISLVEVIFFLIAKNQGKCSLVFLQVF